MNDKKNIYLVQADILRVTPIFSTAYLPYAAGALWAYARRDPAIASQYTLGELFFLREPVDNIVARMEAPFLVGFSCYCWNTEYNKVLAQAVKKRFPECLVLFGGHNVPPGGKMLEALPYVDFLIHDEGEAPFHALLLRLAGESPDLSAVPALSYRAGQGTATNNKMIPDSVEDFPSPYLEGVFDTIIAAHPEIQWSMVWETNRGCPYRCAFCDWAQQKARVRRFPMERLAAEIEWMSANRIDYLMCSDANFGILERDEDILDMLAAAHRRTGYPRTCITQTTKYINERIYRIFDKLSDSGLDSRGPNLAVQSLTPEVLRNIGRENLGDALLARWMGRFRRAGHRTHTDLILGLPGETLQSYCAGVEKLFELGQHEGIVHYPCSLLPNAPMADPAYREKHGIRTARKIFKEVMEGAPEAGQINEFIDVVIETAAMPHEDWRTANSFIFLAQGTHGYGLLRLLAIYLHTEKIASYAEFYLGLLEFCRRQPETFLGEIIARLEKNLDATIRGKEPEPLQIAGFSFGRMYEDQYVFSRAALEPERFYAGIEPFLRQFSLEPGLFAQLLRYQRESILFPGASNKALGFDYDFPAYFSAVYGAKPVALQKKPVRLRFSFDGDLSSPEQYYDAIVRLGRFSGNAFYRIEYLED